MARVSGLPYNQYIQEHILSPLGMAHTSARSPMPSHLRAKECTRANQESVGIISVSFNRVSNSCSYYYIDKASAIACSSVSACPAAQALARACSPSICRALQGVCVPRL